MARVSVERISFLLYLCWVLLFAFDIKLLYNIEIIFYEWQYSFIEFANLCELIQLVDSMRRSTDLPKAIRWFIVTGLLVYLWCGNLTVGNDVYLTMMFCKCLSIHSAYTSIFDRSLYMIECVDAYVCMCLFVCICVCICVCI